MTWYIFQPDKEPMVHPGRLGSMLTTLHEQAHIYYRSNYPPVDNDGSGWYRKDLTPVLIQDVPKDYQLMLVLIK